jgi:hypothetical protein
MFPVFRGSWAFVGVAACLFGELILGPMILIRDDMRCIPKSSPLLWETAISVGWFPPYFGYGMDQLVALAYLRIVAYFSYHMVANGNSFSTFEVYTNH